MIKSNVLQNVDKCSNKKKNTNGFDTEYNTNELNTVQYFKKFFIDYINLYY